MFLVGDCCPFTNDDPYLNDDDCHAGFYNTKACRYDNGSCDKFIYQEKSQFCPDVFRNVTKNGTPVVIGDGICDFVPEYMNEECNWEYGDCLECPVERNTAHKLGDGKCDAALNTAGCHFDNKDCTEFNHKYPNCTVEYPYLIGDGICHGRSYNKKECGYDGGDCTDFNKYFPNCTTEEPAKVGDQVCDIELNIKACGYDGGESKDLEM